MVIFSDEFKAQFVNVISNLRENFGTLNYRVIKIPQNLHDKRVKRISSSSACQQQDSTALYGEASCL